MSGKRKPPKNGDSGSKESKAKQSKVSKMGKNKTMLIIIVFFFFSIMLEVCKPFYLHGGLYLRCKFIVWNLDHVPAACSLGASQENTDIFLKLLFILLVFTILYELQTSFIIYLYI